MDNPLIHIFSNIDGDPSNFALVKSQFLGFLVLYKPTCEYLTYHSDTVKNPLEQGIAYLLEHNVEIIESREIAMQRYAKPWEKD